ncbi:MAG: phosphonate ABC transporter, permease protein PhnE [Candidatus Limnocylindria bacterium]
MSAAPAAGSGRPHPPSRRTKLVATLALAALVTWSIATVGIEFERIVGLPEGFAHIFNRMFLENGPEWAYFPDALGGMLESLQIAWVGTLIGAVLSLPMGLLGAKNVTGGVGSGITRQVLNAIRAVPEVLLAVIIFIPIVGIGGTASAYAGTLAIGVHSIGTLGKLTAEVVEGIDPGPVEAARAVGGGPAQVQRWGVLPQVMPEVVAFWLYRFEINIRASAILGVVGAGGVGEALTQSMVFGRLERAGMIVLVVIGVTVLIDLASGWLRRRIIEGAGARRALGEALEEPSFAGAGAARADTDIG